jgi:hypothetical protein
VSEGLPRTELSQAEKRIQLIKAAKLAKKIDFTNRGITGRFGRETGVRTPPNDLAKTYKYQTHRGGRSLQKRGSLPKIRSPSKAEMIEKSFMRKKAVEKKKAMLKDK